MTEVLSVPAQLTTPSQQPVNIFENKPRLPPASVSIPQSGNIPRNKRLDLEVLSPVNENGSFEFDRVLKSGEVHKRTRKTKQWKKFYLVLRPNLLSIYKTPSEERLHKQINLPDLTAVAYLKDPKGRRDYVFGLFSPAKNFHFQAKNEKDARDWVELIRREARIDEQEEVLLYGSSIAQEHQYPSVAHTLRSSDDHEQWERERIASSSPEPAEAPRRSITRDGIRIPVIAKPSIHDLDYSGNDHGSYSDFSDTAPSRFLGKSAEVTRQKFHDITNTNATAASTNPSEMKRPIFEKNANEISDIHAIQDDDRVIWHGYLLCLKSKGGVRQWKKLWVVLRPKNLAFYKNEEEYSAHLLIPISTIISAVEIDPVSRSKAHCMQIIAEDKSYRFCAPNEEALARWLGALKSQLARRKENVVRKGVVE